MDSDDWRIQSWMKRSNHGEIECIHRKSKKAIENPRAKWRFQHCYVSLPEGKYYTMVNPINNKFQYCNKPVLQTILPNLEKYR